MWRRKIKKLFNFSYFTILLYLVFVLPAFGLTQENSVYEAQGRVDPFVPLISADGRLLNFNKETLQELQVNGIIYDKQGDSFAIVNSIVVKTGDAIGEYKVLSIEEDRVIFDKNGQPLEVGFYKEETE